MVEMRVAKIGSRGARLHCVYKHHNGTKWYSLCGSEDRGLDENSEIYLIENVGLEAVNCRACLHAMKVRKLKEGAAANV